jgi:hypothetical protein
MSKVAFAQEAQVLCTDLAEVSERMTSVFNTYFDRGYNSGGADPIVDGDLTSLGVTASQIAAFITLAENINKFFDNQASLQSDYGSTINGLRTDI